MNETNGNGTKQRLAYNVRETAALLGTSGPSVYKLIYTGQLKHIKIGTQIRIPAKSLEAYIDEQLKATEMNNGR